MYGESPRRALTRSTVKGLSPRVRGIPLAALRGRKGLRSIPACTGNPSDWGADERAIMVYPRVYGESTITQFEVTGRTGLSPRVRGILRHRPLRLGRRRSIPACTGNPIYDIQRLTKTRVYPRVYGESKIPSAQSSECSGLSPRVRGILITSPPHIRETRSIPACTGNPASRNDPRRYGKVYPRVYGESPLRGTLIAAAPGLSPRVRGILGNGRVAKLDTGSIPACTGNPASRTSASWISAVYPRVYGESPPKPREEPAGLGLSPRVRGILRHASPLHRDQWSIPACTGNPRS